MVKARRPFTDSSNRVLTSPQQLLILNFLPFQTLLHFVQVRLSTKRNDSRNFSDLQNALLANLSANNALQLAQYPLSIEEMQSALFGSPALTMMPGWPTTIDPIPADLLSQLPSNLASTQSIGGTHRPSSGKNLSDGWVISILPNRDSKGF